MILAGRALGRVVALCVVALVVGMCLGASVEASSNAHHECNALTDGQKTLSKPPPASPSLVGIPVKAVRLLVPSGVVSRAPSPATEFAAAAPSDSPPARSPPVSG